MSNLNKAFADRLTEIRQRRRLSKTALAKFLDVSTTCVWNWEEGNTQPRPENLSALSKVLGVPVGYFDTRQPILEPELSSAETNSPVVSVTLADVVSRAKIDIAAMAGISPEKVNITLEY